MQSFKLTLAYDGTQYSGWQWQPAKRTVQATLEGLLERITGQFVRVVGSSRTDAGVHALGQVVSFSSDTKLDCETLRRALNAFAPPDLVVLSVEFAPHDFHATRDAVAKRYRYVVQDGPHRDVFARNFAWRVWQTLDVAAMQEAASHLVGTHDFISFQSSGSRRVTTVRTIQDILVQRVSCSNGHAVEGMDRVWIEVQADGFLYNMVRNITGSLVLVGRQRQSAAWMSDVIAAKDRRVAGMTAPPQGLFLLWVQYPT